MTDERNVLCVANAYQKKYYLSSQFEVLPKEVKDELKIMCVLYTEEMGGILSLVYNEQGELCFQVTANEDDFMFDEIGSGLKIREMQRTKQELLQSLQLYYKVTMG